MQDRTAPHACNLGQVSSHPGIKEFIPNLRTAHPARRSPAPPRRKFVQAPASVMDERSTCTPGPMVEDMDTFFT